MNGCCSGRETRGPLGLWLPDDRGEWKRVGVWLYDPTGHPGLLFLGSAAAYGVGRLGMELLRADANSTALPTRINVGFSVMLAVVSLAAFVLKLR